MLSYGGQLLLTDDPAALERVNKALAIGDLRDFARENGPGRLGALGFPWVADEEDAKVNKLLWPIGAITWSRGWFLIDDVGLAKIRPQAYYNGTLTALPFVMDDGLTSITTNLFMLPPRPLGANLTGNDLYLLTLVDVRYFWWEVGASVAVTAGTTTWAQLFASIGTALGVTITVDPIPAAYLKPTADFNTVYEWMPVQLDEAARNVGMRVVRLLDGTVKLVSYATAAATFAVNMAAANALSQRAGGGKLNPIAAGGYMNLQGAGPTSDLGGVLPASVTTVFSAVDSNGIPQPNTTVPVTLAATGLYPSAATYAGTHLLYSSCVAGPTNTTETNALALQLATDWYGWRQESPDVALVGAFPWVLSGMEDQVDWSHHDEEIITRVQRPAWNYRDDETQAFGTLGSMNTTVGGPQNLNNPVINVTKNTTWSVGTGDTLTFSSGGTGLYSFTGFVSLAQVAFPSFTLAAGGNNIVLPADGWVLLNAATPQTLTGFVAPILNGYDLRFTNIGAGAWTFPNQSGSSSAGNLWQNESGGSVVLNTNDSLHYRYDLSSGVSPAPTWREVSKDISAAGGTSGGLFSSATSVTVGNTGTETSLVGTVHGSQSLTGGLTVVGTTFRIRAGGTVTRVSGTLALRFKLGTGAILSTVMTLPVVTGQNWQFDCEVVCNTASATAVWNSNPGFFTLLATAGGTLAAWLQSNGSNADVTTTANLDFTAQWGTADPSNTITCNFVCVERVLA